MGARKVGGGGAEAAAYKIGAFMHRRRVPWVALSLAGAREVAPMRAGEPKRRQESKSAGEREQGRL
jgi:hypothetical protein